MKIRSPLTKLRNTELVDVLDTSFIIDCYKKQLNIDVGRFFQGIREIQIYKCLDSGYRFYYPFNTSGDSKFYEDLEKFSWYYMDWKWEHEIASNIIEPKDRVLEIGCGRGSFMKKVQQKGAGCIGLELNENAALYGQDKKVKILNESIQNHVKNNHERYDVVCSFQVVEHIAKIKEFLQASVDTLKPGGKLIVSVPNNNSFIILENKLILNMPPHHMGLWDINSLINIQQFFGLRVKYIHIEPLQWYHQGYAKDLLNLKLSEKMHNKLGFLANILQNPIAKIVNFNVATMSPYINGHTILVVYSKFSRYKHEK
jgi:SAM-dependent methyltransferase